MKASQNETPCLTAYVNESNHGTSNLLRHLRNKHSINEGEKKNVCGVTGVCNIFLRY